MDSRPRVVLVGEISSLNLALVDNLIANYCRVFVYSKKENYWREKTFYLRQHSFFSIDSKLENEDFAYYVIDLHSFASYPDFKNDLENIYQKALTKNAKVVVLAPLILEGSFEKETLNFVKDYFQNYDLFSLLYLGETFGPRMEGAESIIARTINNAIIEREFPSYSKDFYIFPTFSPFLAKKIVKEVFSFTTPGEGVAFISSQIKYSDLFLLLEQLIADVKKVSSQNSPARELVNFKKRFVVEVNLKKALTETLEWLLKFPPKFIEKTKPQLKKPVVKAVKIELKPIKLTKKRNLKPPKVLINFSVAVLTFLVIPWVLLILALSIFWVSMKTAGIGQFGTAKALLNISTKTVYLGQAENTILTSIPVLGPLFFRQHDLTNLFISTANVGVEATTILEDMSVIFNNTLKKTDYDLPGVSASLGIRIDSLYKDLSFLEGDFDSFGIFKDWLAKIVKENNVTEVRKQILLSKNIFYQLPVLLGANKKSTYLILFQNNMELRPTGGFIGSFALVTFEKGHMTGFDVHDVYEADGVLNGHVEPPEPIKKYLGEASWYLRDSNWDSDFPTSATKSEWFLGKELNKQVDGVVAIDLNIVAKLLDAVGPVYLSDYNKEINSGNLYKEVQQEAEENFFPGSQQKRNILTGLSRILIQKLTELDSEKNIGLAKVIYDGLKERHLLVFMHDRDVAEAISEMGFDGSVKFEKCNQSNCYQDLLGLVEANVGVNKENYYLKRTIEVGVELRPDLVQRILTINYQNTDGSGEKNRAYKNYLRVLVPLDTEVERITVADQEIQNYDLVETQGRKEIGFLVEVAPLGKSQITVVLNSKTDLDFNNKGTYRFSIRKQPGTESDPLLLSIKTLAPINLEAGKGGAFLTKMGEYVYNTNLAEDLKIIGLWK